MISFQTDERWGSGTEHPGDDGSYSIMVPRGKVLIRALDTPLGVREQELDLTGVEGPEFEHDVVLE